MVYHEGYVKSREMYPARYEAGGSSSAPTSKSGVAPWVNMTRAQARSAAQKIGKGWGIEDIEYWSALQILYTVQYADYNCQKVVGQGRCNSSSALNTGGCDSLLMNSGYVKNDGSSAVILDGIENPWGNIFKWLDGINIKSRRAWICKEPENFADDKFASPYVQLGYSNGSSDGYISKLGYDASNPEIQLPTAASGSDSTYIPDYYWQSSGNYVVYVGGDWDYGTSCGLWCWDCYASSSNYDSDLGCRLLYRPVE